MVSPMSIWPNVAGVVFLGIGIIAARKQFAASHGLEKLVTLGRTFVAAALAAFGTEHMFAAKFIMLGVPAWMPFRLFWAYFVGAALIAAALSLALNRCVKWSSLLAAIMILIFVLTIHIPNTIALPHDRFLWIVSARDLCFSAGMAALAASYWGWPKLITAARFYLAAASVFFAVEYFLYPAFAPGLPLQKMTPSWVPVALLWGYLTGLCLLAAGATMAASKPCSRPAAIWLAVVMLVITVALYLPILIMASGTGPIVEGLNYVADTLLFAGTLLVFAEAAGSHEGPKVL